MIATPDLLVDPGAADTRAALVWRFPTPVHVVSSAPVDGGWGPACWLVNIGVTDGYARTDLADHVAEVAACAHLDGPGVGMLTAADVRAVAHATDGGVRVDATVGVTKPTWAAGPDDAHAVRRNGVWVPGTINIVVQVPVPLSPAAAVNVVMTATEAKTQALVEAGVPGTGTASDAVACVSPPAGPAGAPAPEPFGGPRSPWGARVGRAVHAAVRDGMRFGDGTP